MGSEVAEVAEATGMSSTGQEAIPSHHNNCINNGSDLSVAAAVERTGRKWVTQESVAAVERFMGTTLENMSSSNAVIQKGCGPYFSKDVANKRVKSISLYWLTL